MTDLEHALAHINELLIEKREDFTANRNTPEFDEVYEIGIINGLELAKGIIELTR